MGRCSVFVRTSCRYSQHKIDHIVAYDLLAFTPQYIVGNIHLHGAFISADPSSQAVSVCSFRRLADNKNATAGDIRLTWLPLI